MQPNNYFSDFDDLFERMTHASALGRHTDDVDFAVDIAHHDDELVVTADVPGFEKADFDIAVDGDRLTIHAESDAETGVDEETYVRRERHHHAMRRTVHLPTETDGEGASATYRNGVLTVTIPVATDADVRHIDIE